MSSSQTSTVEKKFSLVELSELLAYEELKTDESTQGVLEKRMRRFMHHQIPPNPFKATIRLHRKPIDGERDDDDDVDDLIREHERIWADTIAAAQIVEYDSPASFPPSPFARAKVSEEFHAPTPLFSNIYEYPVVLFYHFPPPAHGKVMTRSAERVDSVMFAVRDRLRLEAQSVSRDEYSRQTAMDAQSRGKCGPHPETLSASSLYHSLAPFPYTVESKRVMVCPMPIHQRQFTNAVAVALPLRRFVRGVRPQAVIRGAGSHVWEPLCDEGGTGAVRDGARDGARGHRTMGVL